MELTRIETAQKAVSDKGDAPNDAARAYREATLEFLARYAKLLQPNDAGKEQRLTGIDLKDPAAQREFWRTEWANKFGKQSKQLFIDAAEEREWEGQDWGLADRGTEKRLRTYPLAALADLRDVRLVLSGLGLHHTEGLAGVCQLKDTLVTIDVSKTSLESLSGLSECRSLRQVIARRLNIESAEGLADLTRLESVTLSSCSQLKNVSALERSGDGRETLSEVYIDGCDALEDLSPILTLNGTIWFRLDAESSDGVLRAARRVVESARKALDGGLSVDDFSATIRIRSAACSPTLERALVEVFNEQRQPSPGNLRVVAGGKAYLLDGSIDRFDADH